MRDRGVSATPCCCRFESGRPHMLYRYAWKNNSVRARCYGRACFVIKYMKRNSVVVQFLDGFRMCTDRRALRRF